MEEIKHYKLQEKLGSGGMGEVYKAFDSVLERHVAVKVMHTFLLKDEKSDERFMREARTAAKLVHPNIVTIYEVDRSEIGRYIVMEYVDGVSLTHLLSSQGALLPEVAVKLGSQILEGLGAAHKMGILHRDIKTDNILITSENICKILDFGIAKMNSQQGLTMAGDILGTVEFMAPEQMLGENVDPRSDLYAAGVVLYKMLANRLPFSGDTPVAVLYKQLNEEPVPPSYYNDKVSQKLDQAILKALSKDKEERWSSAEEFIRALHSALKQNANGAGSSFGSFDDVIVEEDDENADVTPEENTRFRSVFVGRRKEFQKIVGIYNKVQQGNGETVFLLGEAGVGKTTLINRLRTYLKHNDACVLYGACLYQEGMDAYLPFIDSLREFFASQSHSMPESERLKLKELIREKVPLLLEFTEHFSTTFGKPAVKYSSFTEADKAHLFEGIFLLIANISVLRPVVLVIDDMQWADEASLRLFHYLSRHLVNSRILLLGISRTDKYDLQQNGKPTMMVEMLTRMRREGVCKQIEISRLERKECDRLIDESLVNTMFSEEFYEHIYQETKGNPFFVLETLKLLVENGGIYFQDGNWYDKNDSLQLNIPNRVEDVFSRQLSVLNAEEQEILQVGSVMGHKFDVSVISALLDIPKIQILKILQRVEKDLQIVSSTEEGYHFEHPMLKDLLYREIPAILRQEYHLMIAEELEKRYGVNYGTMVGDLAQHFRKGGNHLKAIPLLFQAGNRAFKLSAYREASIFYEDLLESAKKSNQELSDLIPENEFHLKLGICYEEIGRWDDCFEYYKKLLKNSEAAGDYQGQIDALRRMGRVNYRLGNMKVALDNYQQCLHIVDEHPITNVRSRIFNNMGVIYFDKGELKTAYDFFQKTLDSVDSEAGQFDRAHAYCNLGAIANIRGEYKTALDNYEKALQFYQEKEITKSEALIYHNLGMLYSNMEQWDKAIQSYEKCLSFTDALEDKSLLALTHLGMGKVYALQGEITKAKEHTGKASKMLKRLNDMLGVAESYYVYGLIYSRQGKFDEARRFLKDSIQINEERDYHEGIAEGCYLYARICMENNNIKEAKQYFTKALEAYQKLNIQNKVDEIEAVLSAIKNEADVPLESTF